MRNWRVAYEAFERKLQWTEVVVREAAKAAGMTLWIAGLRWRFLDAETAREVLSYWPATTAWRAEGILSFGLTPQQALELAIRLQAGDQPASRQPAA